MSDAPVIEEWLVRLAERHAVRADNLEPSQRAAQLLRRGAPVGKVARITGLSTGWLELVHAEMTATGERATEAA